MAGGAHSVSFSHQAQSHYVHKQSVECNHDFHPSENLSTFHISRALLGSHRLGEISREIDINTIHNSEVCISAYAPPRATISLR
jgi:hypothetical protein